MLRTICPIMVYVFYEKYTRSKRSDFQKYGMNMIITMIELQNISTFWLVWNNALTTKHNCQMIKSEVRFGIADKNENNVSKACIMTVFETIWNCKEKMKTMSLTHALGRYFKRFGTAEKKENKDGKRCIVTIFQTIWNCRKKKKTRTVNGAFWRILKRFGTAEKNMKTMSLKHALWRYFNDFELQRNRWKQCI